MSVGDSELFTRYWYEVSKYTIAFNCRSENEFLELNLKWNVADKGGQFRRWYGNKLYVIEWESNGLKIKNHPKSAVRNAQYFFKPHVSWTLVTSGLFSARLFEEGYLMDTASNCIYFADKNNYFYVLGLLNSKVCQSILTLLNPTINMSCGVVALVPYLLEDVDVDEYVKPNIHISKSDWDSYETSWDFKKHPLI